MGGAEESVEGISRGGGGDGRGGGDHGPGSPKKEAQWRKYSRRSKLLKQAQAAALPSSPSSSDTSALIALVAEMKQELKVRLVNRLPRAWFTQSAARLVYSHRNAPYLLLTGTLISTAHLF